MHKKRELYYSDKVLIVLETFLEKEEVDIIFLKKNTTYTSLNLFGYLKRLEKAGLINHRPDPLSLKHLYHLTNKGRQYRTKVKL